MVDKMRKMDYPEYREYVERKNAEFDAKWEAQRRQDEADKKKLVARLAAVDFQKIPFMFMFPFYLVILFAVFMILNGLLAIMTLGAVWLGIV